MIYCPNCKAQNVEIAKFCTSCGFKITQTAATPVQPPEYQPRQNQSYPPPPGYQKPDPPHNYEQVHSQPAFGKQTTTTGLFKRAKNILFAPNKEWLHIKQEQPNTLKILFSYVLVLALIPAISLLIGYGYIGQASMGYTLRSILTGTSQAIIQVLSTFLTVYLVALIVNMLAPGFSAQKDRGRAFQLVAYGMTPMWVMGILYLFPSIVILKFVAMLLGAGYGFYLMYKGLPVLMSTPTEKAFAYIVVVIIFGFIVLLIITLILGLIMGLISAGIAMGYSM